MSALRSISVRLQLFNGLLLACVLAGFGVAAWRLERTSRLQRVDQELERRIASVSSPRGFQGEREGYYFVLWDREGRETARSASAPADVPLPVGFDDPRSARLRGPFREFIHAEPRDGARILVGREIGDDLAELRLSASLIAATGFVVFLLGLLGGWWITKRALRPIKDISVTAVRIADGDLALRIPVNDAGELSELARVLNATFDRLQAAMERQARFIADASHELRTPVTVLLTETQATLNRERSGKEYRESLAVCQSVARRMRRLIESLLLLARVEAGETEGARGLCRLDELVFEAVLSLAPLSREKGITVRVRADEISCAGRPEALFQVLVNLIDNAIHYNLPGGEVEVTIRGEGSEAVVTVSDNGPGISAEDLPHIFERFYRADKARSRATGHTGLGLAISKAIVEAQGGVIEARSTGGAGAAFIVRLPGKPTEPAPEVSKTP